MALAHKYTVRVDHQYGGPSRHVRIFKEGYGGGVTELKGTAKPVVLDYPGSDNAIFDPVFGSELIVSVFNLTADQLIEFASAGNHDYYAQLSHTDNSIDDWRGWLLPSEVEEPWNQPPYETVLVFNCGLGLLAGYDFLDTDGSYYIDRALLKDIIILGCLAKIYPTTIGGITRPSVRNCNSLLEDTVTLNTTNSNISTSYQNRNKYIRDDGTVWNCLDVLRDIMEIMGARIQMGVNGWWMVRLRDYALFYSGYEMPYQTFNASATYVASATLTAANYGPAVTGPEDRSTMIGWIEGSQRVRYERAYKAIRLKQDYGYRSLILLGGFDSVNWEDFWTTGGSPERAQGADGGYYARLAPGADTIQQTIEGLDTTVTPDQLLVLTFEAMVEYPDTYSQTEFVFDIEFKFDEGGGGDIWYLDGQQGSSPDDPLWVITTVHEFLFTTESGVPDSGKWTKFELNLPKLPSDGSLRIIFKDGQAGGGAGAHTATGYRNIKLFGTYDLEAMTLARNIELDVSDQSIDIMPVKELGLGDIDEQENEGKYWTGALTTDEDGIVPTVNWQSTRVASGTRHLVGPVLPLLDYIKEGYLVQNGTIRKRLSGRMVLDQSRWVMMAISEDSVYYAFTRLTIDLKRGEADVSMLEVPDVLSMIVTQMILGWTNDTFDSFAATADLITAITHTGAGDTADADDAIAYSAYEQFRVTVSGTMTANGFGLDFAGDSGVIADEDDYIITAPSSAGSSTPQLFSALATPITMTNVTITITRLNGY